MTRGCLDAFSTHKRHRDTIKHLPGPILFSATMTTPTTPIYYQPRFFRCMLTGGPNGGKTTVLDGICSVLSADADTFVVKGEESSTAVLKMFSSGVKDALVGDGDSFVFQRCIFLQQKATEGVMELALYSALVSFLNAHRGRVIGYDGLVEDDVPEGSLIRMVSFVGVLDRGFYDGAAFTTEETWGKMGQFVSLDPSTCRESGAPGFDMILHLESRAGSSDPEIRAGYETVSKNTSTERLQDALGAALADERIKKIYEHLPGYLFVPSSREFGDKYMASIAHVRSFLNGNE